MATDVDAAEPTRSRTTAAAAVASAWPPRRDVLRRVAGLLAPAGVYLAVRLIGVAVLNLMAVANDKPYPDVLSAWDGLWYLALADNGYAGVAEDLRDATGGRSAMTALAFFPGYPLLVGALAAVPGVSSLDAGLFVSYGAGVACAYALVRLVRELPMTGRWDLGTRRAGLIAVALFAASPMGVVLSMTFSEALFCALAAWALVGVLERRWLLAALLCLAAGLVRPTAAALVAAVGAAALVAILRRRDGWRPWVAAVLAPLGFVGYLAWVGYRVGRWDGWMLLQKQGWGFAFDGGLGTAEFIADTLAGAPSVFAVAVVGCLLGAITLVLVAARFRLPWPLFGYGAAVVVLAVGSSGLPNVKARLLVPAFVLLIPPAVGLARRRPGTAVAVVSGVAIVSAWFGGYALTAWPYAI